MTGPKETKEAEMQQAVFDMVNNRRIGDVDVSELDVKIIAADNPATGTKEEQP